MGGVHIESGDTNTYGAIVDSNGALKTTATTTPATVGAGTAAAAGRVTLASDDPAVSKLTTLNNLVIGEYETVAASQTAQALGATGAAGDYIGRVIITPATTAPGVVTLLDNATSIPLWIGGTVGADLTPIVIDLGMVSVSGAWKITTGANVTVIAVGNFT